MTGDLRPVVLDAIKRHGSHRTFTTFTFQEAMQVYWGVKGWPDSEVCITILERTPYVTWIKLEAYWLYHPEALLIPDRETEASR